ncbi:MAG: hypothetical protein CMP39_00365 [Rickettsiales bacterium]|nr:hypothetical protein [Rickettsiales bacterium]
MNMSSVNNSLKTQASTLSTIKDGLQNVKTFKDTVGATLESGINTIANKTGISEQVISDTLNATVDGLNAHVTSTTGIDVKACVDMLSSINELTSATTTGEAASAAVDVLCNAMGVEEEVVVAAKEIFSLGASYASSLSGSIPTLALPTSIFNI